MKNNDLLAWMQDKGRGTPPTQAFAFGGIANPVQQSMLRRIDKEYLAERQKELDAYEEQRLAYNSGLTKYQDEVYKPYQAQADAYNTAAQKYNDEVYNPYKTQYEKYEEAVAGYNAGPRTTDYDGPEEPVLASRFEMDLPTAPDDFSLTSPVLPFEEADVTAYQKKAANTARSDAVDRGVALDVVSDPGKYNLSSMSISNRFMAEGGPVDAAPSGQARNMINQMTGLVASAGRGGDTQLAHLSPQSAGLLKSQGGAGTINPKTGLPQYLVIQVPAERYDEAEKTNFKSPDGRPLPGFDLLASYQRGNRTPIETGPIQRTLADEQAMRAIAARDAARRADEKAIADRLADDKSIADRLANEKAARDAARVATEKEAERIYAARVRDQRVANPVTGNVARTVLPTPPDFSYNTRSMSPLAPVDLDNRYIRTPGLVSNRGPSYIPPNPSQQPRQDRPVGPTTLPPFLSNSSNRIPTASDISLPTMGKKKSAITDPKNFFALDPSKPASLPGLLPGTVSLAPLDLPIAAGKKTLEAIAANPNLSPKMLGGQENAGIMIDRLGNRIYSPGAGPLLYRSGGEVSNDINTLLAQNTSTLSDEEPEEAINTNPVGTAQKYLADLSSAGKASPTRQSVKRTKTPTGGGATADKAMQMAQEDLAKGDLGSMKDRAPAAKNTESARSQMEEIARVYQLKIKAAQNAARGLSAATFGAPTLEQPTLTKGKLTKKRFAEGGEAKKSDAKKAESSGFFSNLFKGSDDDFIQSIKNKAEQGLDYKAMLEYLKSRDAVPDVKTGYLPYGVDAVFNTTKLPIGSGTIRINKDIVGSDYKKDIGPSTLAHEMTHATDRQLEQQASEQSGLFSKGNKFTDAYEKMVGPGGMRSGEKRTELARKVHPKWAAKNKDYRSTPYEIAAHGVGNFAGSTTADDAPLHVDATAATEFQILLDLARRNSGSAVKRAEGSPVEGELSQEEIDAASKPAFVTPKSGKGRKEGEISKQLKSGDAYVNMAKGVTELPYDIAGAPMDIAMLVRQGLTGQAPAGQVGTSDYIKSKMTELGIRPAPPADPTSKGFYTAGSLLSNLTNPAGVTRSAVKGAQKTGEATKSLPVDTGINNVGIKLPTTMPNDKVEIQNIADHYVNEFNALGFEAKVEHSGSKAGPSSYVSVSDPTTGRFLQYPIRISDHSKGPFNQQFVNTVVNPLDDLAKYKQRLFDMRAQGPSTKFQLDALTTQYAQEFMSQGVSTKSSWNQARKKAQGFLDATAEQRAGVGKSILKTINKAPVSDIGFYSAAEQAGLNLQRNQGTGQAFINDLIKAPDVKKDELIGMGLLENFGNKASVTKAELQDYLANNRIDVKEVRLGGAISDDPVGIAQRKAVFDKYEPQIQALYKDMDSFGYNTPREVTQSTDNRLRALQEMRDAEADAFYKIPEPTPTKYENYQLPGGENYRELLLTLPEKKNQFPDFEQWITKRYGGEQVPENVRQAARKEYKRQAEGLGISSGYQSSHFDEPNILAHMRVNDRIDADGKKMMFIEEIQSDWHQAGREKGYNKLTQTESDELRKLQKKEQDEDGLFQDDIQRINELESKRARGGDVPDAPFKDTWHQLALKRALKYAADNGYDRVGLTTGRQQVERYTNEMRQNVDEIVFEKSAVNFPVKLDTPNIQITASKNGKETFSGSVSRGKFIDGPAQGKTVEEVLGKSMAKQIAEHKQDVGSIKGDDLTIGGEGMKKYYDEIYPAFLAKQAKKYGAQVGETRLERTASKDDLAAQVYGRGETYKNLPSEGKRQIDRMYMGSNVSIRYIDIAPKMKSVVPYAKGGAVDKNRAFIKAHS